MNSILVKAPWTAEQVDTLNRFQNLGYVHEFTCGNDHEGSRALVATRAGWICPNCDYRQDWANEAMFAPQPERIRPLPCDVMLPPKTILHRGVDYSTLFLALQKRADLAVDETAALRFGERAISEQYPLTNAVSVHVRGSDYSYDGFVVGIAVKMKSGAWRYIVEDESGRLFIHNAEQLGMPEGWTP
jgi:hypothetical protein